MKKEFRKLPFYNHYSGNLVKNHHRPVHIIAPVSFIPVFLLICSFLQYTQQFCFDIATPLSLPTAC